MRCPLQGTDMDGLPSPRATNLVVVMVPKFYDNLRYIDPDTFQNVSRAATSEQLYLSNSLRRHLLQFIYRKEKWPKVKLGLLI